MTAGRAQAETMNEGASAGRPHRPDTDTPAFRGRYLSITSCKRDGGGVATPVWFVQARLHLGRPRTEPAILSITPG
jgi:hypothetical protein